MLSHSVVIKLLDDGILMLPVYFQQALSLGILEDIRQYTQKEKTKVRKRKQRSERVARVN